MRSETVFQMKLDQQKPGGKSRPAGDSSPDSPVPLSTAEEARLIRRAKAKDRQAFGVLYQTYSQAIYHYLWLRLPDEHLAEDLMGEVFVRAINGLPRYTDRGLPFGAWLFRIAHDRLVDYYRQSARRPWVDLDENLTSESPDLDALAESREKARALSKALRKLTDDQRDVVQFRFVEDWSLEDTARMMNKSVNAVKALQHRALAMLGRLLKDEPGYHD